MAGVTPRELGVVALLQQQPHHLRLKFCCFTFGRCRQRCRRHVWQASPSVSWAWWRSAAWPHWRVGHSTSLQNTAGCPPTTSRT
jgi:hypothetical protein